MLRLSFLFILIFIVSTSNSLKAEEKVSITFVDFSDTLKKDSSLRGNVITTLRRYSFVKYIPIIKSDKLKVKKPFANSTNYIQSATAIASNLKANYIIAVYKEVVTNFITNIVANNLENYFETNDIETVITNTQTTYDDTLIKEDINDNTKEETEDIKEEIKETYKMYAIDSQTENIIKEKISQNKNDINNFVREVMETLGVYYANNLLKNISEKKNDLVEIDFFIEAFSYLNQKTRKIENGGNLYFSDTIVLNFKSNEEGYIYILVFQSDGNITLMYPNDFVSDIKIDGETLYTIPEDNAVYQISVSPENGIDNYYILYTKNIIKITSQNTYMSGTGFKTVNKTYLVDFIKYLEKKLKHAKKDSYKLINYKTIYSQYFDETFFQDDIKDKAEENEAEENQNK